MKNQWEMAIFLQSILLLTKNVKIKSSLKPSLAFLRLEKVPYLTVDLWYKKVGNQ